jgi:hypothetical protein
MLGKSIHEITALKEVFKSGGKYKIELIVVFGIINLIVLINALFHDPTIGYDADQHLKYIEALSQLHFVKPHDSREFFSPPLPYFFPALLMATTGMDILPVAKFAQLLNFILSLGSTIYLLKTCQLISYKYSLKINALILLGIIPVYYKTFAYVRGEPYVFFFTIVILYYSLRIFIKDRIKAGDTLMLGIAMGMSGLSRQWGVLIFPAVFFLLTCKWIYFPALRHKIVTTFLTSFFLAFIISGWFYFSLYHNYGSFTAFNRHPSEKISFSNQPQAFYTGISPGKLFDMPVRPNFPNQLIPILYSETWGDYWCFFTIYVKDTRSSEYMNLRTLKKELKEDKLPVWLETNYKPTGAYLGRVNIVSLFPTFIIILSLMFVFVGIIRKQGLDSSIRQSRAVYSFLLLSIGFTIAGYFFFLILYPNPGKGDTIKATYILQVFPFIAISFAILLEYINNYSRLVYKLLLIGLCICFIHNIPAMITHY